VNIKLDENLPERLVSKLQALGHDVDTVRAEHLAGRDDNEVWRAAQSVNRFLITQDLDFSDVRRYTPGTHAGIATGAPCTAWSGCSARPAWRCCSRRSLSIKWRSCLVVATDHKVRVKRPV
jgi:hypothetical protein